MHTSREIIAQVLASRDTSSCLSVGNVLAGGTRAAPQDFSRVAAGGAAGIPLRLLQRPGTAAAAQRTCR